MADAWTIDISRWQGNVDFVALAGTGVQGVWAKCAGADGGLYEDSKWRTYQAGLESVGLPYGTYFFASPAHGDAQRQAQYAVNHGHGAGVMWPVIDVEHNPHGLAPADLDNFTVAFCDEVRRLTGRESIVYTGAYFGVGFTSGHPVGLCPLWVANYGNNSPSTTPPSFEPAIPAAWHHEGWSAWQFNSTTHLAGIPDNSCDQNTVKAAFWSEMLEGEPQEEDEMATRAVVRTKAGSPWASARLGVPNVGEAYWTLIEGAGTARYLWSMDLVNQECFWLGISPSETWLVEDIFMEQRYHHEVESLTGKSATMTATTASTFAIVLVALLWVGLEIGLQQDWYELTQWQIAAIVGLVVVVCAMVAAFVAAQGAAIKRAVERRRSNVEGAPSGRRPS
jgi:GH25 family lysozyme M1 (1,4-beta-N-acetylmuramidase)